MMGEWYWISLPWATFGIEVERGRVVRAAPIAKWAIGKASSFVLDYYRGRGARVVRLARTCNV